MPVADVLAAVAGLLLVAAPAPVVLTVQDPVIDESSGLAVSARHPDLLWTHNDGGDVARVYGLGPGGATVATVTLAGIDPRDPEALAPGVGPAGEPALFLGDIGDNLRARTDVSVFRFDEPAALGDRTVAATWFRFTYPDGPHDAEALLVSPRGRLLIATKDISGQGLYRAPRRLVPESQGTNRLTRVAGAPSLVTDGAYLPDGRFVLRTYSAVYLYDRPGHEVARAELPGQEQGESIAVDGDRLLIGSEGVRSQVLAVPVPEPAVPSAAPAPSGAAPSSGAPPAPGDAGSGAVPRGLPARAEYVAGAAAGLALVVGLVLARRRRRRED